ncbi:hypothetical protein OTU49_006616, partial [Cherax quadricarinatus]
WRRRGARRCSVGGGCGEQRATCAPVGVTCVYLRWSGAPRSRGVIVRASLGRCGQVLLSTTPSVWPALHTRDKGCNRQIMGTRSPRSGYASLHVQERCDPEEYDFEDVLDTYSLPVDATPAATAILVGVPSINTEIYRRPVYRSPPAVRRARRPDQPSSRPADTLVVLAPAAAAAAPTHHHDRQNCSCTCRLHSNKGCKSRSRSRERRLLGMGDLESVLVGGVSGAGGRGVGVASGRNLGLSAGNGSNGGRSVGRGGNASKNCGGLGLPPSCAPGTSVGRGMTVSGPSGSGVGQGSASKGTNGGGARRSVHQPGFLKTVSIIETLSELAHGPEVRRLAQEPQPQRPSRPHSGSRASSRLPTSATSAGGSATDHGDDTPTRPPGPPVLSADFQQYSEKIYDAVTSQGPEPSLRGHGGRVHSIAHPRRRERTQPREKTTIEESQVASGINQEGRREEEEASKKPRPEHRGRERGRTPDWIKRIFDIAKKGDLPSLVSNTTFISLKMSSLISHCPLYYIESLQQITSNS